MMSKHNTKRILAIIPARGKSKGIKNKNIKILAGKPLIEHTINTALQSNYIEKVVVSTDNQTIENISNKYNIDLIKRPTHLAEDKSPIIDTVFHVLEKIKPNYNPEVVILLQPTSPLRSIDDINNSLDLFLKKECNAVIGVYEFNQLHWAFKKRNDYLEGVFGEKYLKMRRQDLPKIYIPNGTLFISTPSNLYKYRSFYSEKVIPYIMPFERSIDIDTNIDFMLSELLIKENEFKIITKNKN